MAKGTIAKELVINKIKQAFGDDFVGVVDGKAYVWAKENGEKLQIALSLTCPKIQIKAEGEPLVAGDLNFGGGLDFESMGTGSVVTSQKAEITDEEKQRISDLMARLGL